MTGVVCLLAAMGCDPVADLQEQSSDTQAASVSEEADNQLGAAGGALSGSKPVKKSSPDPSADTGKRDSKSDGTATKTGGTGEVTPNSPGSGPSNGDGVSTEVASNGRFDNASAAERYGRQSLKKANGTSDPAEAAALALDGWREVRRFPAHAGCHALAKELLAEVKQRDAELTPASRGRVTEGLPLKIR